jgi:restriction endonuclease Mrr
VSSNVLPLQYSVFFINKASTQSNDDGVDAVITNKTSIVGGLAIVQAKRYSIAVGVNHIRELAGAVEEKKAGKGILVTTSWFTGFEVHEGCAGGVGGQRSGQRQVVSPCTSTASGSY